ncbi:MAG: electron transfer flavoprotein subunit beta/FixA family protein [Bacillota bacterium]|nr:electron transfer flavoprotein subunit beta/FixA family protein [Bacillota bacterium]
MNIIVCIKQVPGTNKVEVDPVTGVLKREKVDSKMNPYDLYALETALRLKEAHGGVVKVISMGPPQAKEVLKEAFSMGADDGVLISDRAFGGSDVLSTSYTLSQGIKKLDGFDLILCGKQTTDGDTAQVGPELSEFLKIPSVSNVTKLIEVTNENITVEMDMQNTVEIAKINFPCLLCVDKDIFQPRLPSYLKKMATKNKEIRVLSLNDFEDKNTDNYGLNGSPTQVQRIFPPESNGDHELWAGDGKSVTTKLYDKIKELKFV